MLHTPIHHYSLFVHSAIGPSALSSLGSELRSCGVDDLTPGRQLDTIGLLWGDGELGGTKVLGIHTY